MQFVLFRATHRCKVMLSQKSRPAITKWVFCCPSCTLSETPMPTPVLAVTKQCLPASCHWASGLVGGGFNNLTICGRAGSYSLLKENKRLHISVFYFSVEGFLMILRWANGNSSNRNKHLSNNLQHVHHQHMCRKRTNEGKHNKPAGFY